MDLDQFKLINETCGHPAGDEMLCEVSRLLLHSLRETDTLARLGGDEFGILLENCPPEPALRIAEKLRQAAEALHVHWGKQVLRTGLSIGLVHIGGEVQSARTCCAWPTWPATAPRSAAATASTSTAAMTVNTPAM
jgi:diguanylate cyclase (GGDEF)-like protein